MYANTDANTDKNTGYTSKIAAIIAVSDGIY